MEEKVKIYLYIKNRRPNGQRLRYNSSSLEDIEIKIQLSLILILSSHVVRETSCWLLCCC